MEHSVGYLLAISTGQMSTRLSEGKRKQAIDNDKHSWLFCVIIHKVHAAIECAEDATKT